jgi:CubicO group peptidase (beta-lactamase class C family)
MTRRFIAAALLWPALAAGQNARSSRPAERNDGWKTASPDSMGVDGARLAALTQMVRSSPELGVHAILIERSGRLIYEEYFAAPDQRWGTPLGTVAMTVETKHDLRSVTKSVVSALTGIAVASGAIRLDQPVVQWFPEYEDLDTPDRRRVTLAHVIGMTAGLEWNEDVPYTDPRNDEIRMTRDPAPLRYALSRPFAQDPGSEFTYNGGLTQVMAAVLERATKMPIEDYARTKLFAPLGISTFDWEGDLAGMPSAASGLRLRARDLAKFGSLYLHAGRWNGTQVLPAEWVEQSTRRHFRFRPRGGADAGGEFGYAYFWWYNCFPTAAGNVEARTAVGNGQQRIFVLPGLDMVVTVFANRYNDFSAAAAVGPRILRESILPAVQSGVRPGCPGA